MLDREVARLPARCVHTVKSGETMGSIAQNHGLSLERLLRLNGCRSDSAIRGQRVRVCEEMALQGKTERTPLANRATKPAQSEAGPSRASGTLSVSSPASSSAPPQPPPVVDGRSTACGVALLPHSKDERIAFFSGGDLTAIFGRYVAEIKRTGTRVAWEKLTIVYFDEKSEQQRTGKRLGFGEILAGVSGINRWQSALKGKVASRRVDPVADAKAISSDLACGE